MMTTCEECWEKICICGHRWKSFKSHYKIEVMWAIISTLNNEEIKKVKGMLNEKEN